MEPDAFLFRLLDFLARGGNLVEALQAIHVDFGHALADGFPRHVQGEAHLVGRFRFARGQLFQRGRGLMQRLAQFRLAHPRKLFRLADDRARHVESDVAAADDDDFAAEGHAITEVDVQQEINRAQHAVELHALDGQLAAFVRADAEEHGFKALLLEISKSEVLAEPGVQANLHAERFDGGDFRPDDFARQPVFGHAEHQHAARQIVRLENRRSESHQRQFVRAGQARRTSPNDGHEPCRSAAPASPMRSRRGSRNSG